MIIGEERPKDVKDKILTKKVVLEKTPNGRESLKIIVKASRPGGQANPPADLSRPAAQARPVRSVSPTGRPQGRPKILKLKCPEVGIWKVNESRVWERVVKQKSTFDQLLNKYTKAISKDRPVK